MLAITSKQQPLQHGWVSRALLIIFAIAIFSGCSRSNVVSPKEFTAEAADVLRKSSTMTIVVDGDLQLSAKKANGTNAGTIFLNNPYDMYQRTPAKKEQIIKQFVESWLEGITLEEKSIDPTRIVPVVKDHPWPAQAASVAKQHGKSFELVYDELNPQLVILYVEDTPNNMRYVSEAELKKTKIDRKELRALACDNLQRLLPELKFSGTNGFYMISAGGDYETSLLLLDSFWQDKRLRMKGDPVVALPGRGFFLVGDSANEAGIARLKKLSEKVYEESTYKLTPKLFVRQNNQWVEYE